ncbi:7TM diverse intracellular signaling domain-containing protein [Leptospira sp. WS92.C1]
MCFFLVVLPFSFLFSNSNSEICEFDQISISLENTESKELPKKPKKNLNYLSKENPFLKLGFIKESVWIRFRVKEYPRSRCFLRIPQVTLDSALLFSKSSTQISGDRFPYSERSIDDYYPVFHLEPSDTNNEEKDYYLWIQTSSIINFPLILESGLEYEKGSYYRSLLILFVLVLSLFITLLTGFAYRQTLDPIYLNIVGFLIFISLEGWACYSNGYKYLWSNSPEFQNISPPLFAFLSLACSTYFMHQFLLPASPNKIIRFLLSTSAIFTAIIGIVSSFLSDRPIVVKTFSWMFLTISLIILVSTFSLIRNFKPAKKIMLCILPISGSVLITVLYYLDLIPYNEYYIHAYVLSLPAVYVVVMVSLSDREKFVRRKTVSKAYDIQQLQEKLKKPNRFSESETPNKLPSIQFSLDHLLKVERIFKNPDLTKEDLTTILKITSVELDEFIQKTANISSFENYLNQHRVGEAKHLLRTRSNLKNADIAQRSGFSSLREMEKSFKTLTGVTPSEYKLMVKPESI